MEAVSGAGGGKARRSVQKMLRFSSVLRQLLLRAPSWSPCRRSFKPAPTLARGGAQTAAVATGCRFQIVASARGRRITTTESVDARRSLTAAAQPDATAAASRRSC